MTDARVENEQMSLADIAGLDVSDVEELRTSQLPTGLYTFECEPGRLDTQDVTTKAGDEEERYVGIIELKVVEVDTITEKGVTEAEVLGKKHTERFFIDKAEAQKGIGFMKGFVADIGADNSGNMGGVVGALPGYLDKLQGHRFKAKIIKRKNNKDGQWYSRLQLLTTSKKKG